MRFSPSLAILVCLAGMTGTGPTAAAELASASAIDAVTVFPQGAEVTRIAKVPMEAGSHVVVIRDLPVELVPDSIRVQGEGAGTLVIGSVDSRTYYLSEGQSSDSIVSERKRLEDELIALQDQRQTLVDDMEAAEAQKRLVMNLTALPSKPEPANATGGARAPEEWNEIFTLIGTRLAEVNKAIQELRVSLREVDRRIQDVQNQLNIQPSATLQKTEVRINVSADTAFEATLRIRYQVVAAYWSPIYDARLETGEKDEPPQLTIVRRAVIVQQTPEDWNDVVLTLSTTRPQSGSAAPELEPMIVDYVPTEEQLAKARRKQTVGGQAQSSQDARAPEAELYADEAVAMSEAAPQSVKPALEQQAQAEISAFQAIYVIEGRQTVKSQSGEKRVQIDTKTVEPVLSLRTVPKYSPVAYLYADYKFEPGITLLPGTVSLFRDGVFVGHGYLPLINGGESHKLGFGVDDQVRVKFDVLGRKTGEVGLLSSSTTDTRTFKITIKNGHARPISIRVLDQLPVSANDEIKVEMLTTSNKPTEIDLDNKRGVYAWDLQLEPQAESSINFGYLVSWPKDKRISYSGDPQPVPY